MFGLDGVRLSGFGDYNDANSASFPIALPADVWTTLTNDGLGAFTSLEFLPSGVTSLMDTPSGHINATQLHFGDIVQIRNDYTVTQQNNNSLLEFRYTLGTGLGAYALETVLTRLDAGTVRTYRFSLSHDLIYLRDDNTRNNPIIPQIKLSGIGSVVNSGTVIQVQTR